MPHDKIIKTPKKKFKFSLMLSVFNVEKWIKEAVDSVIDQDIGFAENVQIIFVDDGSTDGSGKICKEYQKKYPNNIIYHKKENGGVASARNAGLEFVEGKYINFFDPDDRLSSDTLRLVWDFFEKHKEEIDVVAIKMEFFEARTGPHMLNYKFKQDAIIDLLKQFDYPQLSAATAFFRREVFDRYRFNPKLEVGEDEQVLAQILSKKMQYGVLANPVYFYRRRNDANSLLNLRYEDGHWFDLALDQIHKFLINYSINVYGKVLKFIQYQILYDLHGQIMTDVEKNLSKTKKQKYYKDIQEILSYIDDDVVARIRFLSAEYKALILGLRHNEDGLKMLEQDGSRIVYRGHCVYSLNKSKIRLAFIQIEDRAINIEGYFVGLMPKNAKTGFADDTKNYYSRDIKKIALTSSFQGKAFFRRHYFRITIPKKKDSIVSIKPIIDTEQGRYYIKLEPQKFSGLNSKLDFGYKVQDEYIISKLFNELTIRKTNFSRHIKNELRYAKQLVKKNEYSIIFVRLLAYLMRPYYFRRQLWLISDRLRDANDNGEALFRHLAQNKPKSVIAIFAIDKNTQDYLKIKRIGKTIDRMSLKYKVLHLCADKIISSHADDSTINPFGEEEEYFRDLFNFDFVFLQHGITKDDVSGWLNKYRKNIKIFITSSPREKRSIIEGAYGYTDKEVKLTGFPRYDQLKNSSKSKIVIAPTWRKNLTIKADELSGKRAYDSNFKNTRYFGFYNGLINSKRLHKELAKQNFVLQLCIHPNYREQVRDFSPNSRIEIARMPYNYKKIFQEGNILVTDYSSVAFDFAYLKKPVIYSQFDQDDFWRNHLYTKGYFSYEDDGFGPVATGIDQTVEEIIKILHNDCKIGTKYEQRVEKFFYKFDKNNSKRVVQEILKLDSQRDD